MEERRIPKIIHYAWFGKGEKNKLTKKCMLSWEKLLPDYEVVEWNEENFDLDLYPYAREAYNNKKYAYVSDVVRLFVLYKYGGIYMDTDVEVLKNLDDLLHLHAFSGFQSEKEIPTGIIASEKGNQWVKEQLDYYIATNFSLEDVEKNVITNVDLITNMSLEKHHLKLNNMKQELKYGMTIFPVEFFCAKNAQSGDLNITQNTYTIHHFAGSWTTPKQKLNKKLYRILRNIPGITKLRNFLKR